MTIKFAAMGDEPQKSSAALFENPNPNTKVDSSKTTTEKGTIVVIMGATGSGKSRLAIDLASHVAGVEVVNADSMQVYRGLDVLTNKVPSSDRKGIPHHLLGTVDSSVEFTSKDFRDLAVPIIDDMLSRNCLPVVVGGTNYYIQALVSPFLIDDAVEDMGEGTTIDRRDLDHRDFPASYERLEEIDPVAANRIHPNDHRKINRYLSVFASSGVLPSTLFQGKAAEKWGRADNFRYKCCFLWVDVSLPVLDKYVNQRVDCMIDNGLLNEVYDIYKPNADYTLGLRQAIGVREFDEFFKEYFLKLETYANSCREGNGRIHNTATSISVLTNKADHTSGPTLLEILGSSDGKLKCLLDEAIDSLKANTRKLVRRQIRRLNRLKTYFGWNLHYIDATDAFLCDSECSWHAKVIEPSIHVVKSFLSDGVGVSTITAELSDVWIQSHVSRDLWSQYVCEACGNQILRGAHEWEQHKHGRRHRKRILSLKRKSLLPFFAS